MQEIMQFLIEYFQDSQIWERVPGTNTFSNDFCEVTLEEKMSMPYIEIIWVEVSNFIVADYCVLGWDKEKVFNSLKMFLVEEQQVATV